MSRPLPNTVTPASRSSSGVSMTISGVVQCRPSSKLRESSTLPNGQTWASRNPEQTANSSPSGPRQTDGQP